MIGQIYRPDLYQHFQVMLYNSEVWPIRDDELQWLSANYRRMLYSIFRLGARARAEKIKVKISTDELLEKMRLPPLPLRLRQNRMRWVGHALRRNEVDMSRKLVLRELAERPSIWSRNVLGDMAELNIGDLEALKRIAGSRNDFNRLTDARMLIDE